MRGRLHRRRTAIAYLKYTVLLVAMLVAVWALMKSRGIEHVAGAMVALGGAAAVASSLSKLAQSQWFAVPSLPTEEGLSSSRSLLAYRIGKVGDERLHQLLGKDYDTPAALRFADYAPGRASQVAGADWNVQPEPLTVDLDDLADLVASQEAQRLVICGGPGAGKTVAATSLMLRLKKATPKNGDGGSWPIPVTVSAAGWTPGMHVASWLAERIALEYDIPLDVTDPLVGHSHILPVIDGLDELDRDGRNAGVGGNLAADLVSQLNGWSHAGEPQPVVITCRIDRYEQLLANGDGLKNSALLAIRDLRPEDIRSYVSRSFGGHPDLTTAWSEVLDRIDASPEWPGATRLVTTPWQLFLAVEASREGWKPAELLSRRGEDRLGAERRARNQLYESYLRLVTERLARRTDSRRADDVILREAQVERLRHTARTLAVHLHWQACTAGQAPRHVAGLSGSDIVPHLLWPIAGVRLVRVLHAVLGVVTLGAVFALLSFFWRGTSPAEGQSPPEWLGILILLMLIAPLPWVVWNGWGKRWLIPYPGGPALYGWLPVRAVKWLWWLVLYHPARPGFISEVRLPVALLRLGKPTRANLATAKRLVRERDDAALWSLDAPARSPMDYLRQYPRNMSFLILMPMLLIWLSLATAAVVIARGHIRLLLWDGISLISVWFLWTLVIAAVFIFTALSGTAWMRYAIGTVIGWLQGKHPLRLGTFLDRACEVGLLRKAGAVWQFRHTELAEWLLEREMASSPKP